MPKPNHEPKPFGPKGTTPPANPAPAPATEASTPAPATEEAPKPDETSPQTEEPKKPETTDGSELDGTDPGGPPPSPPAPDTPPAPPTDPAPAEPPSEPSALPVGEAEVTGEDDEEDKNEQAPTPMEVTGLNGNPEREEGVFMSKARFDAIRRKLREASEARDMWDARARAKEAYDLLG